MDILRFYVFFNSILVMSGGWEADNERLCALELFYKTVIVWKNWKLSSVQVSGPD